MAGTGKKVLLVTGELAYPLVRKYSAESDVSTEIKTLPVSVATFISPAILINGLKNIDPSKYSFLMVPGLVRCALGRVEHELKLPTYKGPRHAADIPLVLDNLEKIKLSKKEPADDLLRSKIRASAKKILEKIESDARKLRSKHDFLVGRGRSAVAAGKNFPTRVIAEIANAPLLQRDQFIATARRYLESGAEIIDIGMVAGNETPEKVPALISTIKDEFDVPVSINTLSKKEIQAAVDAGVDLVVSISGDTIEEFAGLEVPAILVPIDRKRGYFPRSPGQKVNYLLELVKRAEELGYARVIADTILEPVNQGFVGSLISFYELRESKPDIPILMGIGNVVELYDADSVGMVALLVGAASELGASFLLTVEASDKTRGNVAEVRRAREMMALAKFRGSVPKDLGLDLLILKEKRRISDAYDEKIEKRAKVVRARTPRGFKPDPCGSFRISTEGSEIVAVMCKSRGPEMVIKGKTAEEVCHEIVRMGLISDLKHATYLGRELQKAEIALRTGRGYVQDHVVF